MQGGILSLFLFKLYVDRNLDELIDVGRVANWEFVG